MDLNPHPPLTSFPFAILVLILGLELANSYFNSEKLTHAIEVLFWALIVLAPLVFFSGYFSRGFVSEHYQVSGDAIENHKLWAQGLIISLVPTSLFFFLSKSSKLLRGLYLFCLLISATLVSLTGYFGAGLRP